MRQWGKHPISSCCFPSYAFTVNSSLKKKTLTVSRQVARYYISRTTPFSRFLKGAP
jgi:hypothetical protein